MLPIGKKFTTAKIIYSEPRINATVLEENALSANSDWHEICI